VQWRLEIDVRNKEPNNAENEHGEVKNLGLVKDSLELVLLEMELVEGFIGEVARPPRTASDRRVFRDEVERVVLSIIKLLLLQNGFRLRLDRVVLVNVHQVRLVFH
jgi:hypothetical protein